MANIPLKSIKFPGLDDTYTVPQVDADLDTTGAAADAKATGDALGELNERLDDVESGEPYAPAIVTDTEKAYGHVVANAISATFYGNEYAFKPCRYANHKNVLVPVEYTNTTYGFEVVHSGHFIRVNGTDTSSRTIRPIDGMTLDTKIPAGSYTLYFDVDPGDTTFTSDNMFVRVIVVYDDDTEYRLTTAYLKDTDKTVSVTLTQNAKKLSVIVYCIKDTVYDDFTVFYGMYPSDTVFVNTEEVIGDGEEYVCSDTGMRNLAEIDTVQHESIIRDVADTKTYVDNLEIDIYEELPYLTPELFGAIGDGVADDYAAVQACLVASKNSPYKCVRGFGTYKISQGIEIHGRELDIFLHRIIYTGDDAAVTIHAFISHIRFNDIYASAGGANAVGIRCSTLNEDGIYNGVSRCNIEADYVRSNGNTLELISTSGVNDLYYNVFKFRSQYSTNGNIIYINGDLTNEIDFYGKYVYATNGWLLYNANASGKVGEMRLHNYSVEQFVKFGIYNGNNVSMIDCRVEEFMNHGGQTDPRQGRLYVFDGVVPVRFMTSNSMNVSFYTIDVSDAMTFDEAVEAVRADQTSEFWALAARYYNPYSDPAKCERCCIFGNSPSPFSSTRFLGSDGQLIIYYNNKAFKPNREIYWPVTSAELHTGPDYENEFFITPTCFDIDVASTEIYLDPSYCSVALNEFVLRQYENKKAIIYDKNGDLLFDGTNRDAGTYKFKCYFRCVTEEEAAYMANRSGNMYKYLMQVYTGSNENWAISKVDDIS